MYHIGFVIEQTLGHITHTKNLQQNVPQDPTVQAYWALPAWETNSMAGRLPLLSRNWTVRASLQSRQLLASLNRQASLDALFFHTQVTAILARDWVRRIPSVVSLDATPKQYDSLGEFYAHQSGPSWLENWKWRLNRDCFRAAKHLVTWSQWAKDGLVAEYEVPAEKVTIIPPGVSVSKWLRPPGYASRDGDHASSSGLVKILFVGGDLERKGGLLLLDAFRCLRQEAQNQAGNTGSEVELYLVTRDPVPQEPGLHVYNDMQPNSEDLKKLYYDCDIFCLPTYGDCLPMVLSEAAAASLPVVSTKVGAIPEIVHDGQTGFLIPVGDSQALTAALRRLVNDPDLRRQLAIQAVEVAQGRYDAGRNASQLLALLKEVAGQSGEKT